MWQKLETHVLRRHQKLPIARVGTNILLVPVGRSGFGALEPTLLGLSFSMTVTWEKLVPEPGLVIGGSLQLG